jgi:hypothetical protein
MKLHKRYCEEFPDRLDHAQKLRLKYQVTALPIDTGGGPAEQIRRHLAGVRAMERQKAHFFLIGYKTRSLPYRLVEIAAS